jgi:hypothetical protein
MLVVQHKVECEEHQESREGVEMSEWIKIEKRLADGVEDLFEEALRLWDDRMNATRDGAWDRFVMECRARYEMGRAQHAGTPSTWESWSFDEFEKNIREELMDYVIYSAAQHARSVTNHARR